MCELKRHSLSLGISCIRSEFQDSHVKSVPYHFHYSDLTDSTNLIRLGPHTQLIESGNIVAETPVQVSFETPEYAANADVIGTLCLLQTMGDAPIAKDT